MENQTPIDYLKSENKTLSSLLVKLNQLKKWNSGLRECLPEEKILTEHSQIVGVDGTSLIVIADSSHWVARFRFFIPELLIKLRNYPGLQNIRAICCKVRPQNYKAGSKKIKRRPLNISIENANMLRETAHKIHDEKLRKILEKIARLAEN